MPEVPMDQATADRLTAEAKFFRAFNYFYLVKTFGAVPFYTDPYELAENMELPRTETSTIYNQIESDLKDAMNVLPEATFAANGHRITKYVAAMTLTDVYMYQHKYCLLYTSIILITAITIRTRSIHLIHYLTQPILSLPRLTRIVV